MIEPADPKNTQPFQWTPPGPRHAQVLQEQFQPPSGDAVHQPPHYARWKMQPIEFLMINDVPGWLFNVVKYCFRYDAKDGLQDLYKARSYLDMKIRALEGVDRFWEAPVATERKLNGR